MTRTIESTEARTVEQLLGLEARSLHAVERRANGDFVLCFKHQCLDRRWRRTLRIPARRVAGYQPRYPGFVPPERDVRARRKRNAQSFAFWLTWRVDHGAPVARCAFSEDCLAAIDELRAAIVALAPPTDDSGEETS